MFCTSFLLKQPLEHLNQLLSYQLSHTRKTITIPLIIWTSDTFRRKFLFFFLRWFTTCSIGTSVVMSPEESTMHTIFYFSFKLFFWRYKPAFLMRISFFNCSHQSSPPFQGVIARLYFPISCPTHLLSLLMNTIQ